ncbi:PAS domain S-box protein [Kibdelosporangium aridum]|uniref:PAS domain S-box protein n=1 Tax=Kibdelosporangium aridum TaxID=2030 RepID=UPI0035F0697E
MAGRNIRELFPEEDADDVVISYREVTEGIMPRIRERRRMVRHDGTIAWVYLVISLLRDVNGVPAYHVTMVENLSELQALQNQLGQQSVRDMLTGVATASTSSPNWTPCWKVRARHVDHAAARRHRLVLGDQQRSRSPGR